jgi:hypothetical protein
MSKSFRNKKKHEKWNVTILFKEFSYEALQKDVFYSLRYDRGVKPGNQGQTKPAKAQLGSVLWGHAATFICTMVPSRDGEFEKKFLTMGLHEHPSITRAGRLVGKEITINLAKYIDSKDKDFGFPMKMPLGGQAIVHLVIRAKRCESTMYESDDDDLTDTHRSRSGYSTVEALSDVGDSDFHSDHEPNGVGPPGQSLKKLTRNDLEEIERRRNYGDIRGEPRRPGSVHGSEDSHRSNRSKRSQEGRLEPRIESRRGDPSETLALRAKVMDLAAQLRKKDSPDASSKLLIQNLKRENQRYQELLERERENNQKLYSSYVKTNGELLDQVQKTEQYYETTQEMLMREKLRQDHYNYARPPPRRYECSECVVL